jgi:cellulose synthase/poly-beta-1,6-N-acetylglucosamine synthase-like glycosyltransferase
MIKIIISIIIILLIVLFINNNKKTILKFINKKINLFNRSYNIYSKISEHIYNLNKNKILVKHFHTEQTDIFFDRVDTLHDNFMNLKHNIFDIDGILKDTFNSLLKSAEDEAKKFIDDARDTVKDTVYDAGDTVKDTVYDAGDTVKDFTKKLKFW